MTASTARRTASPAGALLVLGLLVLLAEVVAFALYGRTVYDEGGYLYEGWLAVSKGWLPFRDFYAKLPPMLYYVYGLGQHWCGPSLLVGRVEAALFMFGALALGLAVSARLGGRWAAVLLVWLTACSPAALNSYLHVYAVAPTGFFMMLALSLLILPRPGPRPLVGAACATAAMLLCRHDLLPAGMAIWAWILWQYPGSWRLRIGGVLASWLVFAAALLPFYLQAPQNVLWALTLGHLGPQLKEFVGYGMLAPPTPFLIAFHAKAFVREYAGPLLLLAPALAALARIRGGPDAPPTPQLRALWLLLGVAAFNWLCHVPAALLSGANVFYLIDLYIFFPVAVGAVVAFMLLVRASASTPASQGEAAPWPLRRAWIALAAVALLMPLFTGPGPNFRFSRAHPTDLERVQRGAAVLRRTIEPGAVIFTIDDPHQFLEAGLLLPHSLTHQMFNYRESPQTEVVSGLHLFNAEMIRAWLGGQARYAVISTESEDWMARSGRIAGGPRLRDMMFGLLHRNYALIATEPDTLAGQLRIYRLKDRAGPGGAP